MLLAVYVEDLGEYPTDIIKETCRDFRRTKKFFPIISEIRETCEEKFEFRRALLRALANARSGVRFLTSG
jgi:hypothetical protein